MKKWYHSVVSVFAGLALVGVTHAQDITDFENGYLTFTNEDTALFYRIEFRPNLTGPEEWDGHHNRWKNIQTNAGSVTVPVGVFYRVVGSTNPVDIGTAGAGDILAFKTVYVNGQVVTGSLYTLTYHLNGGYNHGSNRYWYTPETETFALYDPQKGEAPFEGWFTNAGYSGDSVTSVLAGTSGDLIFFAKWAAESNIFNYTGDVQPWSVPTDVTNVQIECWGAQGGNGGAQGGYAKGYRGVIPGQYLYIYVGGVGSGSNGGWNGGGNAGGGGEGAGGGGSDVRNGGTGYGDRIIVAGGGGGNGGGGGSSGEGGDTSGGNGGIGSGAGGGSGGAGGGPASGGSGGSCCSGEGTSGSYGEGGDGGTPGDGYGGGGGGGGGGGWYGGGGGGGGADGDPGGGGGGGSGYIGGVSNGVMQAGTNQGFGRVVITSL